MHAFITVPDHGALYCLLISCNFTRKKKGRRLGTGVLHANCSDITHTTTAGYLHSRVEKWIVASSRGRWDGSIRPKISERDVICGGGWYNPAVVATIYSSAAGGARERKSNGCSYTAALADSLFLSGPAVTAVWHRQHLAPVFSGSGRSWLE